jgi:hypothetical protein
MNMSLLFVVALLAAPLLTQAGQVDLPFLANCIK